MAEYTRDQIRAIEEFLRAWDPIGVFEEPESREEVSDEYDSYAPGILGMLHRGCTADDIAVHLRRIQIEDMKIPPVEKRDVGIATQIAAWWKEEND